MTKKTQQRKSRSVIMSSSGRSLPSLHRPEGYPQIEGEKVRKRKRQNLETPKN